MLVGVSASPSLRIKFHLQWLYSAAPGLTGIIAGMEEDKNTWLRTLENSSELLQWTWPKLHLSNPNFVFQSYSYVNAGKTGNKRQLLFV